MWYCENKDCSLHGKDVDRDTSNFPYQSKEEREKICACTECGSKLAFKKQKREVVGLARFSSLSESDKKEILKKRADSHYEKFCKDEVNFKKASVVKQIKEEARG